MIVLQFLGINDTYVKESEINKLLETARDFSVMCVSV